MSACAATNERPPGPCVPLHHGTIGKGAREANRGSCRNWRRRPCASGVGQRRRPALARREGPATPPPGRRVGRGLAPPSSQEGCTTQEPPVGKCPREIADPAACVGNDRRRGGEGAAAGRERAVEAEPEVGGGQRRQRWEAELGPAAARSARGGGEGRGGREGRVGWGLGLEGSPSVIYSRATQGSYFNHQI